MKKLDRYARKSYAMFRMKLAIERAIERPTPKEKERAARWAAAWGLLCGIKTAAVNLKACDIQSLEHRIEQTGNPAITFAAFSPHGSKATVQPQFLLNTPSSLPLTAYPIGELVPRPAVPSKPV
jgi:hypothetical protein